MLFLKFYSLIYVPIVQTCMQADTTITFSPTLVAHKHCRYCNVIDSEGRVTDLTNASRDSRFRPSLPCHPHWQVINSKERKHLFINRASPIIRTSFNVRGNCYITCCELHRIHIRYTFFSQHDERPPPRTSQRSKLFTVTKKHIRTSNVS